MSDAEMFAYATDPRSDIYTRNQKYLREGATNFNTNLGEAEPAFLDWVSKNRVPFDPNDRFSDYDMRGFYQALQAGDPRAASAIDPHDKRLHYPDYWKTPFHETFSRESQWATPDAPYWSKDGRYLRSSDGQILFDAKKRR